MADEIMAYPVQGYSTYSVKGRGILLKLALIARNQETGAEATQDFPLQLSVAQARDLAQSLLDAAVAAEMGQSPSTTRN